MADYCDQGAAAGDMHLQVALKNARAAKRDDVEYLYCRECGEKIPEARRKAVPCCTLCVGCQTLKEKNGG